MYLLDLCLALCLFFSSRLIKIIHTHSFNIIYVPFHCIKVYSENTECLATGMQNGDKARPSIISAGHGILVKMIITLEPHIIYFDHILHKIHFNIV